MHALYFHAKRLHLRTVKAGQDLFVGRVEGMTPARYDLLSLVRSANKMFGKPERNWGGRGQKSICQQLGLSRQTVSRMIVRLKEMGWVESVVDHADKRQRIIGLTELGYRKIRKAMRLIVRRRPLMEAFELCARWLRPTSHVLEGLDFLRDTIDGLARMLGDESAWFYDYGSKTEYGPSRAHPRRNFTPEQVREMMRLERLGQLDMFDWVG